MRLERVGFVRLPVRRARFGGAGLAVLGAVGLGLAVIPACGGGGTGGDDAVHLQGSAVHAAAVVAGGSLAPDCSGGGGVHN